MSPSGDGTKDLDTSNPWPIARPQPVLTKENTIRNINHNNNNLLRRASLAETKCSTKKDPMLTVVLKTANDDDKKPPLSSPSPQQCNLPDVLPVNAKASPTRSHLILNNDVEKPPERLSPNKSPPIISLQRSPSLNSPPRNSPVLDARNRDSPRIRESPRSRESPPKIIRKSSINSPNISPIHSPRITSSPSQTSTISTSPSSLKFTSDSPRLSLSPPSSPIKSPIKNTFESSGDSVEKSLPTTCDHPKVIEGLQLIQRTEVTLRVNTCTIDAASQTEKELLPSTPLPTRRKLQEEIDCERLSQDLANHLSPSDRLKCILGKFTFIFISRT